MKLILAKLINKQNGENMIYANQQQLLQHPVADLNIRRNIVAALNKSDVKILEDLVILSKEFVQKIPGIGTGRIDAIEHELANHQLRFGMKLENTYLSKPEELQDLTIIHKTINQILAQKNVEFSDRIRIITFILVEETFSQFGRAVLSLGIDESDHKRICGDVKDMLMKRIVLHIDQAMRDFFSKKRIV